MYFVWIAYYSRNKGKTNAWLGWKALITVGPSFIETVSKNGGCIVYAWTWIYFDIS